MIDGRRGPCGNFCRKFVVRIERQRADKTLPKRDHRAKLSEGIANKTIPEVGENIEEA